MRRLIQLLILIGHLYLSGMWFWCDSKNMYQEDMCLEGIGGLHARNMTIVRVICEVEEMEPWI